MRRPPQPAGTGDDPGRIAFGPSTAPAGVEDEDLGMSRLLEDSDPSPLIHERVAALTDDPIAVEVADIHVGIHRLLLLHRDIHDGVGLAADQVRDIRIDFLERGPDIDASDVFLQFALAFFLESPLAGHLVKTVLGQAYRMVSEPARLALATSRSAKIARLEDVFRRRSAELAQNLRAGSEVSGRLARLPRDHPEVSTLHKEKRILDLQRKALTEARGRAERKRDDHEPSVVADKLHEFFASTRKIKGEYGLAATKSVAAAPKASEAVPSALDGGGRAADSIGVQLKAQAQRTLRDVEFVLGMIAADADLLRDLARADPILGQACAEILQEMGDVVRSRVPKNADSPDPAQATFLATERLIWALLVHTRGYEPIRSVPVPASGLPERDLLDPPPGLRDVDVLPVATGNPPPPRLTEYLRARFYAPTTTLEEMLADLDEVQKAFRTQDRAPDHLFSSAPLIGRLRDQASP